MRKNPGRKERRKEVKGHPVMATADAVYKGTFLEPNKVEMARKSIEQHKYTKRGHHSRPVW